MSTKNTKLVLVDKRRVNHDNKSVFLVKKTVNTIDYKVGSYLSEQAVRDVMLDVWMVDNHWFWGDRTISKILKYIATVIIAIILYHHL